MSVGGGRTHTLLRLGLPMLALTSSFARGGARCSVAVAPAAAALRYASTHHTPTTCVIGHTHPDTDAICSAIIRARELEMDGVAAQAYRLGDLNPETEFVLKKFKVDAPPLLPNLKARRCDNVAIVDTNNPAELPEDVEKANVTSIVDHHKLSGLSTAAPIEMDVRPLCSTGSVLYYRFLSKGYPISADIASLMLSCILSDSLHFRSVTTTPFDEEAARQLATIADVDLDELGSSMLEAKSQISHLTAQQLALLDSKTYTIHGKRTRVSVIETTHSPSVLSRSTEILGAVEAIKKKEALDSMLFFVVDIVANHAILVSSDQAEAARVSDAFNMAGIHASVGETDSEYHVALPEVLSRKKQIIPALEA